MKGAKLLVVAGGLLAIASPMSSCTRSPPALASAVVDGGGASARDPGLGNTYHRIETQRTDKEKAEKQAQAQANQQKQKQQEQQQRDQQGGQAGSNLPDTQRSKTTQEGPPPGPSSFFLPKLGEGEPSYGYEWRYLGPIAPWGGPGSNSSVPGVNNTSPGARTFPFTPMGRPIPFTPSG
jgi:type II secretory pathway pseudopilin PulG